MRDPARERVLNSLVQFDRPLRLIAEELNAFPFDCEPEDVVTLTRSKAAMILARYLSGQLRDIDLEDWGKLIEARFDMGFEPGPHGKQVKNLVLTLANQEVEEKLTPQTARLWILRLGYPLPQHLQG